MHAALAYAETNDPSSANLVFVVAGAGLIAAAAVLGFVAVALAWSRRHRHADLVVGGAVLWGLLAAGVAVYAVNARQQASKEYVLRLQTGYYDPDASPPTTPWPWGTFAGLGAAYAALLAFATLGGGRGR